MVKEAKFFRKQADKAERAARASSNVEVSEDLLAMARAYRDQAALIKKKQKPENKKSPNRARPGKKEARRKRRS